MPQELNKRGLAYGVSAYLIWGLFPLFMAVLAPANALEIVSWRALSSLAVCLVIVAVVRRWAQLSALLRDRQVLWRLSVASALIAVNWGVMVYAVLTDRVSSTSLGYYINPLVTVALSVVFLGERLRRLQVVAIIIAGLAVVVMAVELRGLPWISLVLAVSFALYSFIKKGVSHKVDALSGLTIETLVLAPVAAGVLWWVTTSGNATFLTRGEPGLGWWHDVMLAGTGTWTAGALLVFAAGAALLPLNVTGLLQYIAPTMTFVLAVTVFGEHMPLARWAGFGLVWLAVILITADAWRSRRGMAREVAVTTPSQ